jgi:uncharacterized protein (DUF4415 family)
MKKEYDFSKGKRGAVIPQQGKTRITIYIDSDIISEFRELSDQEGYGYQTMINQALKEYLQKSKEPMEKLIRRVIREELKKAG